MKLLVETTGSFMLMDEGQEVQADRPSVVVSTHFIQSRIALGQIKVLGKLKDEATDLEFLEFVRESDKDMPMAVESYLSAFGVEAITEKGDEKKGDEKKGDEKKGKGGRGKRDEQPKPNEGGEGGEGGQPQE